VGATFLNILDGLMQTAVQPYIGLERGGERRIENLTMPTRDILTVLPAWELTARKQHNAGS
jgi:hypothetical protein